MNVLHILSVEKLRDGGSLIVSFQADDSCEYWLMLAVKVSDEANCDFNSPALVNRTMGIEADLGWFGAKSWLQRLKSHIDESDHQLFNTIWSIVCENT